MTTSLGLGGSDGPRLVLPVVPVKGIPAAGVQPPEPSERRSDLHTEGFPWPGEWTSLRDEARQATKVTWRGKMASTYPWGKELDHEQLTYELEDAHPEKCTVLGEAETIITLKDRVLT